MVNSSNTNSRVAALQAQLGNGVTLEGSNVYGLQQVMINGPAPVAVAAAPVAVPVAPAAPVTVVGNNDMF